MINQDNTEALCSDSQKGLGDSGKKIKVQSCFGLPEEMILPEGVETVAHLLAHLGRQIRYPFITPDSGELEEDLEVTLNGKEIWFYPGALSTLLKEGDLLELYMLPLGGG